MSRDTNIVDRRRQCDGKVKFPDRRAARVARQRMGRRTADGHLAICPCPWCRAFHLGHAWQDPYLVDMRARQQAAADNDLAADVIIATARALGITEAEAARILEPVVDEVHHLTDDQLDTIVHRLGGTLDELVYFTTTAERTDG